MRNRSDRDWYAVCFRIAMEFHSNKHRFQSSRQSNCRVSFILMLSFAQLFFFPAIVEAADGISETGLNNWEWGQIRSKASKGYGDWISVVLDTAYLVIIMAMESNALTDFCDTLTQGTTKRLFISLLLCTFLRHTISYFATRCIEYRVRSASACVWRHMV